MAIQINGNGTITGISVGGLPDGIVDTDMIAASAATTAKFGSGSIIQVAVGSGTGNQASGGCNASASGSTSTDDNAVVDAYMTFTPLRATSTMIIYVNSGCSINGGRAQFSIFDSAGGGTLGTTGWGNFGGAQSMEGVFLTGVHRPGNTSQRTYQLRCDQVGSLTRYRNYDAICQMIIMEIAA